MIQVSLDTSFLISFADPARPHHQVAVDYLDYFVANKIPMYLSAIAAGEFEIGQPLEQLPLQNFRPQSYNFIHAKRAALLFRLNRQHAPPVADGPRACVINDLKILAQAVEENIPIIMTEDGSTLAKIITRLRDKGLINVHACLLASGFAPLQLANPGSVQLELEAAQPAVADEVAGQVAALEESPKVSDTPTEPVDERDPASTEDKAERHETAQTAPETTAPAGGESTGNERSAADAPDAKKPVEIEQALGLGVEQPETEVPTLQQPRSATGDPAGN